MIQDWKTEDIMAMLKQKKAEAKSLLTRRWRCNE
jgi:hypothetical protein